MAGWGNPAALALWLLILLGLPVGASIQVVAPRAVVESHWDANNTNVAPHRIRIDVLGS